MTVVSERKYRFWVAQYERHLQMLCSGVDVREALHQDICWLHNRQNCRAAQAVFNLPILRGETVSEWRVRFMERVSERFNGGNKE